MTCTACNDTGRELDPFENDGSTISCGACGGLDLSKIHRLKPLALGIDCPNCGEPGAPQFGGAISREDLAAVRRILGNLAESPAGLDGHARTFDLGYRAGINAALNTLKSYER